MLSKLTLEDLTKPEYLELELRFENYTFDNHPKLGDVQSSVTLATGTIITYTGERTGQSIIVNIDRSKPNLGKQGMKFDDDKLLCMAMPAVEYKQILEVLTKGARKYKIDNWKIVEDARNRYMNGMERHFLDYKEAIQTGKNELKYDNGQGGMGTHHLANLICNAIFLMYFDNNNIK